MDMRLFLIRQRAKDAATLVLNLHMKGAIRRQLLLFAHSLILSLSPIPEEELLHVSDFIDDLLLALELPCVELPVLEVIKHDCKQAHPFI